MDTNVIDRWQTHANVKSEERKPVKMTFFQDWNVMGIKDSIKMRDL